MFNIFNKNKKTGPSSASIAKDRLQISIKRQKSHDQFDFLPKLEKDILDVVRRYIEVSDQNVNCDMHEENDEEILELNIIMPPRD